MEHYSECILLKLFFRGEYENYDNWSIMILSLIKVNVLNLQFFVFFIQKFGSV